MKRYIAVAIAVVCALPVLVGAQGVLAVPDDYPTIQEALDASDSGDVIEIAPGTYIENLEVLWPVTITAAQTDSMTVTIQSDIWDKPALTVWTDDEEIPVVLSHLVITGAWAERGILVSGASSVSMIACDVTGNLVGMEVADQAVAFVRDSTFSENSETCIQGNGSALVNVVGTIFYGSEQSHMVRTPFGNPVTLIFDDCSFYGTVGDPRDIGIYAGPGSFVTVTNSFFESLGTGIETHQTETFLAQGNEIDKCDGGIWVWNIETSRTDVQILDNTITHGSTGIILAGHVASIEISDNKIMYCGQGINVQLPLCGGSEAPFSGQITGQGNILRGGLPRTHVLHTALRSGLKGFSSRVCPTSVSGLGGFS